MHKRRLMTLRVVGMAILLTAIPSWSAFAADGNSKGDAPARPQPAQPTQHHDQIALLKKKMVLQQQKIEQMQKALAEQNRLLDQLTKPAAPALKWLSRLNRHRPHRRAGRFAVPLHEFGCCGFHYSDDSAGPE